MWSRYVDAERKINSFEFLRYDTNGLLAYASIPPSTETRLSFHSLSWNDSVPPLVVTAGLQAMLDSDTRNTRTQQCDNDYCQPMSGSKEASRGPARRRDRNRSKRTKKRINWCVYRIYCAWLQTANVNVPIIYRIECMYAADSCAIGGNCRQAPEIICICPINFHTSTSTLLVPLITRIL